MDAEKIVKELTFEEKTKLLTGHGLMNTYPIERLGVKSVKSADGPHGVRSPRLSCNRPHRFLRKIRLGIPLHGTG